MKWKILNELSNLHISDTVPLLLANRHINTEAEKADFLHPTLDDLTPEKLHVNLTQLKKAQDRIKKAIEKKETIVIYGDYDVDGVTGTAILWEALHGLGANVHPYIPLRSEEGYGLSLAGIENIKKQEKLQDCSLIITVDNGIMAHPAVAFANSLGIDVIVTDHHELSDTLPDAYAIIHTLDICGAGVGWVLAQSLDSSAKETYLDLLTLSTISDLMPLSGPNRAIVFHGLPTLRKTKRVGLQELFKEAGIEDPSRIDVYEIGHIIAPRLNAMGRLESAMDSLRLLCTKNPGKARDLAHLLGETNRGRQLLMQAAAMQAVEEVKRSGSEKQIIIHVGEYEEGIIGLVAGRLVEAFHKPAIVITKKELVAKASARSVDGFDIISFIRTQEEHLLNAGGHPMAAGFSLLPEKVEEVKKLMEALIAKEGIQVTYEKELIIDCALPFALVSQTLYDNVQTLAPFGLANPEPLFVSDVIVDDLRTIGKDKTHIKITLRKDGSTIDSVGFGMAEKCKTLHSGDACQIVYSVQENVWNGRKNLQLLLKDIQI